MAQLDDPVYDRSLAISQLAGDETLFSAIAAVFVAECEGYCAALEAALASANSVDLRREAHTAKSMLASFLAKAAEYSRSVWRTLRLRAALMVLPR